MKRKPDPELIDLENPEWRAAEMAHSVPFAGLPKSLRVKLRGPQETPSKIPTTIRCDIEVLETPKVSS